MADQDPVRSGDVTEPAPASSPHTPPAPTRLRPAEIQSLLRSGATAEELAERANVPLGHIRRFEWPIITERDHAIRRVRSVEIPGRLGLDSLGDVADARLDARGINPADVTWSARRGHAGPWLVEARYLLAGRDRSARWTFEFRTGQVTALDDQARWLSLPDEPLTPETFTGLGAGSGLGVDGPGVEGLGDHSPSDYQAHEHTAGQPRLQELDGQQAHSRAHNRVTRLSRRKPAAAANSGDASQSPVAPVTPLGRPTGGHSTGTGHSTVTSQPTGQGRENPSQASASDSRAASEGRPHSALPDSDEDLDTTRILDVLSSRRVQRRGVQDKMRHRDGRPLSGPIPVVADGARLDHERLDHRPQPPRRRLDPVPEHGQLFHLSAVDSSTGQASTGQARGKDQTRGKRQARSQTQTQVGPGHQVGSASSPGAQQADTKADADQVDTSSDTMASVVELDLWTARNHRSQGPAQGQDSTHSQDADQLSPDDQADDQGGSDNQPPVSAAVKAVARPGRKGTKTTSGKGKRPQVPSWDEIVFGARSED